MPRVKVKAAMMIAACFGVNRLSDIQYPFKHVVSELYALIDSFDVATAYRELNLGHDVSMVVNRGFDRVIPPMPTAFGEVYVSSGFHGYRSVPISLYEL